MRLLLVSTCLVVAIGLAQCDPMKILKMMSLAMGPPESLDDCLEDMMAGFQVKMGMVQKYASLKLGCKKQALPEDLVKCLPEDGVFKNFETKVEEMKALWSPVKEKFGGCLRKKAEGGEGCTNEPKKLGGCEGKIMKAMFPEDAKEKFGQCIMKEGLSALPDLVKEAVVNNMKSEERKEKAQKFLGDLQLMANAVQAIKGPIGGGLKMKDKKPRKGPKPEFMKLLGKGLIGPMCLKLFCEQSAINDCTKEAGFTETMDKMFLLFEQMKKNWEDRFPEVCSCMSKSEDASAKIKEVLGIKEITCDTIPKFEACGKLMWDKYSMMKEHMMMEFAKKPEQPAASRKRRSLDDIMQMDFEGFELEFDEFYL